MECLRFQSSGRRRLLLWKLLERESGTKCRLLGHINLVASGFTTSDGKEMPPLPPAKPFGMCKQKRKRSLSDWAIFFLSFILKSALKILTIFWALLHSLFKKWILLQWVVILSWSKKEINYAGIFAGKQSRIYWFLLKKQFMKKIPHFGSLWELSKSVLEFLAFLASKWTDGVSYLKGLVSTWDSVSTHRGAFNLVDGRWSNNHHEPLIITTQK